MISDDISLKFEGYTDANNDIPAFAEIDHLVIFPTGYTKQRAKNRNGYNIDLHNTLINVINLLNL